MHYCCLIITEKFPTDEVVAEALKPYNEDDYYSQPKESRIEPLILWDWWRVGGRYNGRLKLCIEGNEEKYEWNYYSRERREGRQFRSYLLNDMMKKKKNAFDNFIREEDYFPSMGSLDGYIRVDGAAISDIINLPADIGYYLICKDGTAYCRENCDFYERLKEEIANSQNCYICVVDLHD